MSGEVDTSQSERDVRALEDFVVGNEDLERLEALLGRFNIFEAIGMVKQELRHSDFLAYLLDPRANHGLGDAFVKRLLQTILTTTVAGSPVTPIELELWNLDRIEVRREWKHIDILLLDHEHELVVIIENKIYSGEHSGQLDRYHRLVSQQYPRWRIIGLYLTPGGDAPSHGGYLPVDYGLVCDVVDGLAESRASVVNPDVKTLMAHYTEMLRRRIVGDSQIARLCRQIYHRHKRALDLIYDHRPDPKVETREFLTELIRNTEGLVYKGRHRNDYIFFRPEGWEEVPAFNAGEARAGFFRFVFHNNQPDRLNLLLESSPGDLVVRRRLFEMGQRNESVFNYLRDPDTTDYPKLYRRHFLTPRFTEEATDEDRVREIHRQWAGFLEDDLPRIEAALKAEKWTWESAEELEEEPSSRSEGFVWADDDIEIIQRPDDPEP